MLRVQCTVSLADRHSLILMAAGHLVGGKLGVVPLRDGRQSLLGNIHQITGEHETHRVLVEAGRNIARLPLQPRVRDVLNESVVEVLLLLLRLHRRVGHVFRVRHHESRVSRHGLIVLGLCLDLLRTGVGQFLLGFCRAGVPHSSFRGVPHTRVCRVLVGFLLSEVTGDSLPTLHLKDFGIQSRGNRYGLAYFVGVVLLLDSGFSGFSGCFVSVRFRYFAHSASIALYPRSSSSLLRFCKL